VPIGLRRSEKYQQSQQRCPYTPDQVAVRFVTVACQPSPLSRYLKQLGRPRHHRAED
jgi:hypothetical protein